MDDPSGSGAGDDITAVKRTREEPPPSDNSDSAAADEVDRLSPLPEEILAQILSCVAVDSSTDAVQTSVLSQHWHRLWKLVPELRLPFFPQPTMASSFRDALDGHQVRLRHLQIEGQGGEGARPSSLSTWLPAAARRVSGSFVLRNTAALEDGEEAEDEEQEEASEVEDDDEPEDGEAAATIELPCFENATSISICLGLLGSLVMPPVPPPAADVAAAGGGGGVFSNLTDLSLERVWFHHPSELGDAVSSARCPHLQTLKLRLTPGLEALSISSTSLLKITLEEEIDLLELAVDAPELRELTVVHCFMFSLAASRPVVVAITAPALELLDWRDDMESQQLVQAQLLRLPCLRSLGSFLFFVYGSDNYFGVYNRGFLEILRHIQFLENLSLTLTYVEDIENYQYLMEDMTTLPKVTTMHLIVTSLGHSIGASLFHILKLCPGIRKLVLELHAAPGMEEPLTCPPGCNCEHQSNWQSEKLLLVGLEEIEIQRFGRTNRDLDFVERLFGWAAPLRKATIIFDIIVREDVAMELCRIFGLFSRPEIHIEFRYHNNKKLLYPPED